MTPDPRFLFHSKGHREALAVLRYAIIDNRGFAVLVGEAGTGKTLLLHSLIAALPDDTAAAYLFCPRMKFRDLLRYLLSEFNQDAPPRLSEGELLMRLNDYLTDRLARGRRTVLIIDEAQNMEEDLLESIRMLSNLETAESKLLQIILAGQPELDAKLARPNLRQLRQRVSLKAVISPLERSETTEYIRFRLEVAGHRGPLPFDEAAVDLIHEYSRGIPRTINVVADNVLLLAYAADSRTITRRLAGEAIRDLERGSPRVRNLGPGPGFPARRVAAAAAALFVLSLGAYGVMRLRPTRDATAPAKNLSIASADALPVEQSSQESVGDPSEVSASAGDSFPAASSTPAPPVPLSPLPAAIGAVTGAASPGTPTPVPSPPPTATRPPEPQATAPDESEEAPPAPPETAGNAKRGRDTPEDAISMATVTPTGTATPAMSPTATPRPHQIIPLLFAPPLWDTMSAAARDHAEAREPAEELP